MLSYRKVLKTARLNQGKLYVRKSNASSAPHLGNPFQARLVLCKGIVAQTLIAVLRGDIIYCEILRRGAHLSPGTMSATPIGTMAAPPPRD